MDPETHLSSSSIPQDDIEMRNKDNPLVFMDLSIDGTAAGRFVIELYKDVMPKTAENFRALCTGERGIGITTGKPLHYKGSLLYFIHDRMFAEGGDIENTDGIGGESSYGGTFEAENDRMLRSKRGMLYMGHCRERIDSKFVIVFQNLFFIERNAVVGRIIEGIEILEKIEQLGTDTGKPIGLVKIIDCGEVPQGNVIESDKGEYETFGKRAISSVESPDGPVTKQRGSTVLYKEVPVMCHNRSLL